MRLSRARQKLFALVLGTLRLWPVSFCVAIAFAALIASQLPAPVSADSYEGVQSYDQGRKQEAIHILRRSAWQDNDLFAQLKLGDIYVARSDSDKGFRDPVEAAVWYYIALLNVTALENYYLPAVRDKIGTRLSEAQTKLQEIYKNLLQDERIDLRNRITYIEACRGPEGLMLLGQLHDPRLDRTGLSAPSGGDDNRPQYNTDSSWSPGGSYGGSYPTYSSGPTPWRSPLYQDAQPIEKSELEARLFYKLAEAENYPYAKEYLEELSISSSYGSTDPKQAELQARAKAERWLSPFEFYAAETRYRGELPSGLVLSDECPINNTRERALALGKRLIPPSVLYEFLEFLDFARGFSPREMDRAVSKYQDFLGEPQTGELTAIQLVRLIQIAAVRGHKKAQRCLGIMYVKGVGVVRNLVRAEKWLLAADLQGDGEAAYALSELYSLGGRGIEKSEDRATRYRQSAAVAGFQPVRSEFLRLLETPPPAETERRNPDRPRRHYRQRGQEEGGDE